MYVISAHACYSSTFSLFPHIDDVGFIGSVGGGPLLGRKSEPIEELRKLRAAIVSAIKTRIGLLQKVPERPREDPTVVVGIFLDDTLDVLLQ